MSISKVINKIGDEKIKWQSLNESIKDVKSTKYGNEITFYSGEMTPSELLSNTGKIGLVLWVDKSDLQAAVAMNQEGK